jgi:hypothetical protein
MSLTAWRRIIKKVGGGGYGSKASSASEAESLA